MKEENQQLFNENNEMSNIQQKYKEMEELYVILYFLLHMQNSTIKEKEDLMKQVEDFRQLYSFELSLL